MTTSAVTTGNGAPNDSSGAWKWIKRILLGLLVAVLLLLVLAVAALLYLRIPQNAASLAAQSVCSAHFVGGREGSAEELMEQDVLPASPALSLVSTTIDEEQRSVTAKFLRVLPATASLQAERGCVLDLPPDPAAQPYVPAPADPAVWPQGDAALPVDQWDEGVDVAALQQVVDQAFVGQGDVTAANTRGLAVVRNGQMLVMRDGDAFVPNTALHGWSMTKTVAAMLAYAKFQEVGLDIETPVVDAFPAGQEPEWVASWREDERSQITVADLFFMRDGLDINEGYDPTGEVVRMLYSEPDMAQWAADHKLEAAPGTKWEYLSATSNILADVVQGQFASEADYWAYPETKLFGPLGANTATLETDTVGTWVGSSYLWASVGDWARFGQMMLDDGQWQGGQVLPAGWWELAGTRAMPTGEGTGYGAQTWRRGDPVGGKCRDYPGVPEDTLGMGGVRGQTVAMVPSYDAVIVRMGWTFNSEAYDDCQLISDVLATMTPVAQTTPNG